MRRGSVLSFSHTALHFIIMCSIACILSLALLLGPGIGGGGSARGEPESMGETLVVNDTLEITDTIVILNGNLTIGPAGNVTITGSELQVNSTNVTRYAITVQQGGRLTLTDSLVTRNRTFGFDFIVNGSMVIENSTVSWMNTFNGIEDSGLYVRSSDVVIGNSTIINWGAVSKAITVNNSAPTIRNSVLSSQYYGAFLVNGSHPVFINTNFTTSYDVGVGLLCSESAFTLRYCTIFGNSYGLDIRSGPGSVTASGEVYDTNISGNRVGVILSPGSGMSPLFSSCTFMENEWSAMFLYGNATIENCVFESNIVPGPISPIAAITLRRSGDQSNFMITNSTFKGNHNGIVAGSVVLSVSNCTFENNTRYGGSDGIVIYVPEDGSDITIEESRFTEQKYAVKVIYGNESANILLRSNSFTSCTQGITAWNSTLTVTQNTFTDCEIAIKEHYRKGINSTNNTYVNTPLHYRYLVRLQLHVIDGYGVDLDGAQVEIMPEGEIGDLISEFPLEFGTVNGGLVFTDIVWREESDTTIVFSPYNITVVYQGLTVNETFETAQPFNTLNVTIPFLRPNLIVTDLEVKSNSSSIIEDDVMINEEALITFTVMNTGEGLANGSTVVVRQGGRTIYTTIFSLESSEDRDFEISWTPDFKGLVNISVLVSDPNELNESENSLSAIIDVEFLRPNLIVKDLEVKSIGFSIIHDKVRKDEEALITFTIRNRGEGLAEGSTVIVRQGESTIYTKTFSLDHLKDKDFEISWTPDFEGKINISVKVSDPNELNDSENSLSTIIDVGEEQRGYYYVSILLTVLVLLALIRWMAGNIEGANKDMAEFSRNLKRWLSGLFETWASKLTDEDERDLADSSNFIPSGDIYSWDGESALTGTGKFTPWTIEDENILREKKTDVMTIQIKIPLPEPEIIEDIPEMETFEWVTAHGQKETIQVDKRTIMKISHPKMFICSLCDKNFVSVNQAAKCPWCSGKAYFIQDV